MTLSLGFEHREEAERFLAELRERLAQFGLELHADKTRMIEFGRFAEQTRRKRGDGQTGHVQLPGLHAQLREDAEGGFHGAAADDAETVASQAAGGKG